MFVTKCFLIVHYFERLMYVHSQLLITGTGGVDPGGWRGFDPLKICRRGQSMFWPQKCHILSFQTIVRYMFHRLMSKMEGFEAPIQAARNREWWVFENHWWLELTDPDSWPHILRQIYATALVSATYDYTCVSVYRLILTVCLHFGEKKQSSLLLL